MNEYTIIWELSIRHSYYVNGRSYIFDVKPTRATEQLMKRRGIIFRKRKGGNWILIGDEGVEFAEDDAIEMNVYAKDPYFPYVTDGLVLSSGSSRIVEVNGTEPSPIDLPGVDCPESKADPGVILKIVFSPAPEPEKTRMPLYTSDIVFRTAERYLEYLFLFRDRRDDRKLVLEDLSGKETFLPAEKIAFEGVPGTCIRSTRKIILSQEPGILMRLVEMIGTHVRVIEKNIALPTPGMFANTSPEMLRHIMYV